MEEYGEQYIMYTTTDTTELKTMMRARYPWDMGIGVPWSLPCRSIFDYSVVVCVCSTMHDLPCPPSYFCCPVEGTKSANGLLRHGVLYSPTPLGHMPKVYQDASSQEVLPRNSAGQGDGHGFIGPKVGHRRGPSYKLRAQIWKRNHRLLTPTHRLLPY